MEKDNYAKYYEAFPALKELIELAEQDAENIEQALVLAESIKNELITAVEGTSKAFRAYDVIANALIFIMFNHFGISSYDNLVSEMVAVQQNPITPFHEAFKKDDEEKKSE